MSRRASHAARLQITPCQGGPYFLINDLIKLVGGWLLGGMAAHGLRHRPRLARAIKLGVLLGLPLVLAARSPWSWPVRALLALSYLVVSFGLFCLSVALDREVSHPSAGVIVGVPCLAVGGLLLGLVRHELPTDS